MSSSTSSGSETGFGGPDILYERFPDLHLQQLRLFTFSTFRLCFLYYQDT
jgi:hypothetical protein